MSISWHKKRQNHIRRIPVNLYNRVEQKLKNSDLLSKKEKQAASVTNPSLIKCPKCGKMVDKRRVMKRKFVCYECGGYFRISTKNRIRMVSDPGTFEQWFENQPIRNPLNYKGYEEKLQAAREKTGLSEGVTVGKCRI